MGRRKGGVLLLKPNQIIVDNIDPRKREFTILPKENKTGLCLAFTYYDETTGKVYLSKTKARVLMRRLEAIFEKHDFGDPLHGGISMSDSRKGI